MNSCKNMLKMEYRLISNDSSEQMLKNLPTIDFDTVDAIIDEEKKKSVNFLNNALKPYSFALKKS